MRICHMYKDARVCSTICIKKQKKKDALTLHETKNSYHHVHQPASPFYNVNKKKIFANPLPQSLMFAGVKERVTETKK